MADTATTRAGLRVRDYMSSTVSTLSPDDRLLDADLLVRRASVRHMPVLKDGKLVGLLTERDIRRYAPSILHSTPEEYNAIFEQTRVEKVMTHQVKTISPDAPLAEAASTLYQERLGCMPVVEDGKLVGIITRTDIMRFANDALLGNQ
jgi:acetoin utilization protein AcuB